MSRTWFVVLVVAALALVGGAVWYLWETPEGRRRNLEYELAQSQPRYEAALRQLHEDGPEGQAVIIAGMRRRAEPGNKEYWFGSVIKDVPALPDPEPYAEVLGELLPSPAGAGAIKSLARMGPKAKAALPAVAAFLKADGPTGGAHAEAAEFYFKLAAPGPERREVAAACLKRGEARGVRLSAEAEPDLAVAHLLKFSPDARRAFREAARAAPAAMVPLLGKLLRSGDAASATAAIEELKEIEAPASAAPDLIAVVGRKLPDAVREAALLLLETLGPDTPFGEDETRRAFKEGGVALRQAALRRLAARSAAPVEEVRAGLKDAEPAVRVQALHLASRHVPALSAELAQALRGGLQQEKDAAAVALLWSGRAGGAVLNAALLEADKPAAQALLGVLVVQAGATEAHRAALGEMMPGLRKRLAGGSLEVPRILYQAGPAAAPAVDDLLPLMGHDQLKYRGEAALALGAIGPAAKKAVPALVGLAKFGPKALPVTATHALGRIGPDAAESVPAILEIAKTGDAGLRAVALEALASIGDARGMPALRAVLDPKLPPDLEPARSAALRGLGRMGAKAAPLVPDLVALLGAGKVGRLTRLRVLEALEAIGPAAREAAPALEAALKDKDALVRLAAASALWRVDPSKADAIVAAAGPIARSCMDGSSESMRAETAAARLLGRIGAPAAVKAVPDLAAAVGSSSYVISGGFFFRRPPFGGGEWRVERSTTAAAILEAARSGPGGPFRHIVRESAAEALAKIGPPAKAALPALLKAWKADGGFSSAEHRKRVKGAVGRAIRAIDPRAAEEAGIP